MDSDLKELIKSKDAFEKEIQSLTIEIEALNSAKNFDRPID